MENSMGRNKIQRECSFKPHFKKFAPTEDKQAGLIELNSDEMEAVFLMDYQGLYQEDAAKNMNISRPTLSRIIKNARKKIATALISGFELIIVDNKDKFIVALSVENKGDFSSLSNSGQFIALIHLKNKKILSINYVENPLTCKDIKPSEILPSFLKKHHVHYWISSKIGEGLKNSLLTKGIFIKEVEKLKPIENITKLFC
jgi:predicted DNA-binding protein (UPF0251 family)